MKMTREFNECVVELDVDSTCCILKILRTEDSAEGFTNYKSAMIAAANRLIDVLEDEESTHRPQLENF